MIALGAIGIVYGALIALVQKDLKQLAAYGTLGHVSVVILGIFTFTIAGIDGGIYATLNEGIGGGALFMLLGILYERYGTYDMRDYGGLAAKLPWMVTLFVITTLSVIGLPMLNGFVGEFLVLTGGMQSAVTHHTRWTVFATTGVIFTASYMLWMIQRVFYGDLNDNTADVPAPDLDAREHLALWPMVRAHALDGCRLSDMDASDRHRRHRFHPGARRDRTSSVGRRRTALRPRRQPPRRNRLHHPRNGGHEVNVH